MNSETIVAVLASGGLGAILVAIINGVFSKRKLGAEATEIITRAAAGVVESLERQLKAERELSAARERSFREQRDVWSQSWRQHIEWDETVIATMAKAGIKLPPAPPAPRFHE